MFETITNGFVVKYDYSHTARNASRPTSPSLSFAASFEVGHVSAAAEPVAS